MNLEPFHHDRAIRAGSAGAARWPRVQALRSTTPEGRARWTRAAGPFRTQRAAARAARQQRDARGIHYAWFPGALLYGVIREDGAWWVLTRPARGKSPPTSTARREGGSFFDAALPEVPF